MKKLLQQWLGITEPKSEEDLRKIIKEVVQECIPKEKSERELRKMIGQALLDAVSGQQDESWMTSYWGVGGNRLWNTFEAAVDRLTVEPARSQAQKLINERIGTEKFIDEIVERIQRKQLK